MMNLQKYLKWKSLAEKQKKNPSSYNFDDRNVVKTDQIVMKSDVIIKISDQNHYSFLRQCKKK